MALFEGIPPTPVAEIIIVHWVYNDGPHKGASFWAAHGVENDGRLRDWPTMNMSPLGAAKVTVTDGRGLDLLPAATAKP